jgi:hypothetical protein
MKRSFAIFLFLLIAGTCYAQSEVPSWARMRYELKVNALSLSFAELNMQAELPMSPHTGLHFFAGFLFTDNNTSQTEAFGNWGFAGATYRFYARDYHKGFFFGPFLKYRLSINSQNVLIFDPVLAEPSRERITSYTSDVYFGLEIGNKGYISDNYFYEVFLGMGRTLNRSSSSGFVSEEFNGMELTNFRVGIVFSKRFIKY